MEQNNRKQRTNLEKQLKKTLDQDDNLRKHNSIKNELHVIYGQITEDIEFEPSTTGMNTEKNQKIFS